MLLGSGILSASLWWSQFLLSTFGIEWKVLLGLLSF